EGAPPRCLGTRPPPQANGSRRCEGSNDHFIIQYRQRNRSDRRARKRSMGRARNREGLQERMVRVRNGQNESASVPRSGGDGARLSLGGIAWAFLTSKRFSLGR